MVDFFKEFIAFLMERKKSGFYNFYFLVIFGGLLVLSQGTVVAPFIYTLF